MKSYTDLEQSKKLAEILPLESADMYYKPADGFCTEPSEPMIGDIKYAHPRSIRCWSLAALLGVLPEKYIELIKEGGMYRIIIKNSYITCLFDNPVDACYEMILKLHEFKVLVYEYNKLK